MNCVRWKLIDSHVSSLLLLLLVLAGAGAGRENISLSLSSGVMWARIAWDEKRICVHMHANLYRLWDLHIPITHPWCLLELMSVCVACQWPIHSLCDLIGSHSIFHTLFLFFCSPLLSCYIMILWMWAEEALLVPSSRWTNTKQAVHGISAAITSNKLQTCMHICIWQYISRACIQVCLICNRMHCWAG